MPYTTVRRGLRDTVECATLSERVQRPSEKDAAAHSLGVIRGGPRCSLSWFSDVVKGMQKQAGTWLAGNQYVLVEKVHQDGPIEFWNARQQGSLGSGQNVLLALPHELYLANAERKALLQARHQQTRLQPHKNILPLAHIHGQEFLVYKPFSGLTLRQLLQSFASGAHTIPWPSAVKIVTLVCRGLQFLYDSPTPILHGDLRPENILLNAQGDIVFVQVGELHLWQDLFPQWPEVVLRRLSYAAPERWMESSTRISPQADMFSLGVLLYELLCGHLPFEGNNIKQLQSTMLAPPKKLQRQLAHVPRELHTTIRKLLSFSPTARYNSSAELQKVLEEILYSYDEYPDKHNLTQLYRTARPRPATGSYMALNAAPTSSGRRYDDDDDDEIEILEEIDDIEEIDDFDLVELLEEEEDLHSEELRPVQSLTSSAPAQHTETPSAEFEDLLSDLMTFSESLEDLEAVGHDDPVPHSYSSASIDALPAASPFAVSAQSAQESSFPDELMLPLEEDNPTYIGEEDESEMTLIAEFDEEDEPTFIAPSQLNPNAPPVEWDEEDDLDVPTNIQNIPPPPPPFGGRKDPFDVPSQPSPFDTPSPPSPFDTQAPSPSALDFYEDPFAEDDDTDISFAAKEALTSSPTQPPQALFSSTVMGEQDEQLDFLDDDDIELVEDFGDATLLPGDMTYIPEPAQANANAQRTLVPGEVTEFPGDATQMAYDKPTPPTTSPKNIPIASPSRPGPPVASPSRPGPPTASPSRPTPPVASAGKRPIPIASPPHFAQTTPERADFSAEQVSALEELAPHPDKPTSSKGIWFFLPLILILLSIGGLATAAVLYPQLFSGLWGESKNPTTPLARTNQKEKTPPPPPTRPEDAPLVAPKSIPTPKQAPSKEKVPTEVKIPDAVDPPRRVTPPTRARPAEPSRPRKRRETRPAPRRPVRKRLTRRRPPKRRTRRKPPKRIQPKAFTGAEISIKPACTIYIDNKKQGSSSPTLKIALSAGTHRVRCVNRKAHYQKAFTLNIKKGQTTRHNSTSAIGTLIVRSTPWSIIQAGRYGFVGRSGQRIQLPVGKYRLVLFKKGSKIPGPGMQVILRNIQLRAGKVTRTKMVSFPTFDDE